MTKLQVYKRKTVLVKRTGEKIVVDMPFEVVEKAMQNDVVKIGNWHTIRSKAINERYEYNITNEIEARVDENFRDISEQLMDIINDRKKRWLRISKEIVASIASKVYKDNLCFDSEKKGQDLMNDFIKKQLS